MQCTFNLIVPGKLRCADIEIYSLHTKKLMVPAKVISLNLSNLDYKI